MDCAKADMHVDVSFPCKSSVVGNIGFQVLFIRGHTILRSTKRDGII